jgi:hypothetical protein
MSSFRVRRKIFATVPPDDAHLHVFVDEAETCAAVAESPTAFEELWWGTQLRGVRVNLAAADADRVSELLEEAWRKRAPRGLVVAHDAATGRAPARSESGQNRPLTADGGRRTAHSKEGEHELCASR